MKWPWQKAPENRGTITFLPDGRTIVGVPHGTDEATTANVVRDLRRWDEWNWQSAVFPFPVDVDDRRRQR